MFKAKHSITLLFNANKVYDRQVIEGIGHYLQSSKVDWDLYLEEDFSCRLEHIHEWGGDGIIADFDDMNIQRALAGTDKPIVAVGGDRKSTRLNSSHVKNSYAVFCLKKKKNKRKDDAIMSQIGK